MIPDPDGVGSNPQPLLCVGTLPAPAAETAEPATPLDPGGGMGGPALGAATPACPVPGSELGFGMGTPPALAPVFAPGARVAGVPPVPDGAAPVLTTTVAPAIPLEFELLASVPELQADRIQPNANTLHRAAQ